MQNFSNSPSTLPPGFPSRGGNLVGSPYPPHISDPQISPRTIEDYAAMQQSQSILQSHGQHPHLRGQQHPGQASHIHGYGSRRGAGEIPQATGSSSNTYRKESMDYFFSMSGRDRNRRGGGSFGAGFGYSNMEYQYRHVSGSGPSSGMVSPYPMDYSTSAATGSGSGNSNSSGSGSFSPTQQFSMAQNASMQPVSGVEMHQRQHSQKYPSHQGLHPGHRAYPLSGHRIPSHFGHYPPLNVPTPSVGMYNSPPQRYEMSSGNMDPKINSPTPNTTPGSAASNNSGHQENAGQSYPSNHPPYSPQSHPVPKHTSRRTAQHSLGAAYDTPLKMQHAPPGLAHPKNQQSSVSLSPAAPHHASQDISKSPMQSQNQQTPMNQNFSPISNPSPVPSAVHSPSCSSSSSPLMGVSEGLGSSASLHSSLLNPRSSHSHIRAQHTMSQLSPTPSSNSSISSCGSVVSSAGNQNRMGVGLRGGQREETSSLYPQDKLSQDPGLNSLNALTSQVANLPNTVQHTMLTDTVLSQKKRRENTHQPLLQQTVSNQQKHRNASAAGRSTANEESGNVLASEPEETSKNHSDHSEHEKVRQPDGFSTESKPANYYSVSPNPTQNQTEQSRPGRHLQKDDRVTEGSVKQSFSQVAKPFSQIKAPETQTPSSSSPPCIPPEPSPNASSCAPAPSASSSAASSPTHSVQSNCVIEPDLGHDEKTGLKEKKTSDIMKVEKHTVKHEELSHQELDNGKNTQTLATVKLEQSGPAEQNENEKDDDKNNSQHFLSRTLNTPEQSNSGVGVIVSARSEQNPEGLKQTEVTSHHSTSSDMGKLNYPEEKHSINMFRDSGSHNGDGEIGIETFTAHYDVSPKTEFGQNVSSNHCQAGSYKYCNPEMPYNACMGAKIKVRAGPGSGIGANRYQDYHQSQSNFAYVSRKDVGVLGVMGKSGIGPREIGAPFSNAPHRESGCLPYLDEAHSLDDLLPYRAEDAYSCDSQVLKPGVTASTGTTLRNLPTDFDFGLGTAGSSGPGPVEGDKDEFTLLGPLPPPPPLPRPVQGSPPPSSSALSDIQQFTNTYQQLETRRGEQSAANLLRQKLQETGMGFDDYPGGDFYGATPPHGQSPGHHLLSRPPHELSSPRTTASDSKLQESFVPKGYFPSGKKKGRPNQPVKVEVEGEGDDNQPEMDMKPIKHRQRKGKEVTEGTGSKSRQWRKSRGMSSKEELDPQTVGVGNAGTLQDTRKNIFSPYVHVERKITEIGAVCTVVNSEDEKSKGGNKNGASGVDGISNVSLISQMVRKEREIERMQEKGIDEPNDSVMQSGKSLPTSGYVLPGPVMAETGHTGRLLCCLCQKWANFKNLGDLYGPFYPADYAAKFPKNQPQVRQILSNPGAANTGSNPSSVSTELTVPDIQSVYLPDISSADTSCSVSQTTNPVSPAVSENLPCLSTTTKAPEQNWNLIPEGALATLDPPELENELTQRRQQKAEDVQQRPQHRKLTSHPRFKRRHKSSEDLPRTIPINSKASLPFQPPPPSLDSLGPLAQLAQLPVVPLDPKELWVHESCIIWTSGVYLVNGRLYGLQEALDGARETSCSHCEMAGSTLGCYSKGCTLRYHYLCAVEADCCLNEDNFSLRCPKHKCPQTSRPAKPAAAHQEQSERG
ncbi:hypothetical protein AMELA_G00176370 [Ameiurus melas]|uniref:PHD-type domain-containing protein n=1 Tax=Ameiurus melas TaxID=219545 RepID=A0A7J6AD48_AMEME|nr:hypothetical protein AMELA_G00176370 [Ameiurus melas]